MRAHIIQIEVPVKATPTAPAVRDNHKVNGIPVGPSKTSVSAPDRRAATTTPASAPSAPRAQLSTTPASTPPPGAKPVPLSTKAIERYRFLLSLPFGARLTCNKCA